MFVSKYNSAEHLWLQVITLVGLLLAVCALVGCNKKYDQAGTAGGEPLVGAFRAEDENPFLHRAKRQPAKPQQVVQLNVWRITIKPQSSGSLEQLWSLLRPARLIQGNSELLARNGLHVAAGGAADWPKMVNLLGLARKEQDPILSAKTAARVGGPIHTVLADGFVAELSISNSPTDQTLFWNQRDGRLVGRTFEDCHKLILVSATPQPTGQTQLQIMPALKEQAAKFMAVHWLLRPQPTAEPKRYVATFEPLAFEVAVNPNEFLALGTATQAGEAIFGSVFFQADQAQQPATTVLLIVPQIITDVPGKGFIGPDGTKPTMPSGS